MARLVGIVGLGCMGDYRLWQIASGDSILAFGLP
jgi:hypothetical protein